MGAKRRMIELNPRLLEASTYHGVGNIMVSNLFFNLLSLMKIF